MSSSARWTALALCLLLPVVAAAQSEVEPAPAVEASSLDPHDPSVPVGAVRAFIDAARSGDYVTAARHLQIEPSSSRDGAQTLARKLKVVLDRELWVQYDLMSQAVEGELEDGLAPDVDRVAGDGPVEIYVQRVADPEHGLVWKFSSGSVARIPMLYDEYGYGPLGEWLPPVMFEIRLFELELWQWIGLLLALLAAWLGSWIGLTVLRWVALPLVARTRSDWDDKLLDRLAAPARLLIGLGLFTLCSWLLRLSVPAYRFLGGMEKALAVVAGTWVVFRAVDILSEVFAEKLRKEERRTAIAVLPLGRRTIKFFLVALAFTGVLQNLGWNVTGLIAGLGVGGLAFALAAQKSIENLFGGVTLIADQPVRVGDFCRFGGHSGTVEEIGLRSTRIRTLERTLITVPNSAFSEIHLENLAHRDRIRLSTVLGLRYETSPDQLRHTLSELRRLLLSHPKVLADSVRVRFGGFGASSLDIELQAYVGTADWGAFTAIREDLYLRVMDIVEAAGTGFAFPSQTLYLGRDDGLNSEKRAEAEASIARLRASGQLPFPDHDAATIARFADSVDYPPRGSVGVDAGDRAGASDDPD